MRALSATVSACLLLAACGERTEEAPPAMGTLERDRIELSAEVAEPVVSFAVREGDRVNAGDLVARLDTSRIDARIDHARALRDTADANLRLAVRGPRSERILEAQARLAATEGSLATSRSQLARMERLVDQEIETVARLDEARGRFEEAQGRRDEARSALEALLEGTTLEELDLARAALAAAEATLSQLELDRERLEIRAPVAGRIDALPYELGERPTVGRPVAVLLAAHRTYARVHVPAPLRTRLRDREWALVAVDGVETPFEGTLRWVSSDAAFTPYYALTQHDRGRLAYLAEVDLDPAAAGELPTGVPVEVRFPGVEGR